MSEVLARIRSNSVLSRPAAASRAGRGMARTLAQRLRALPSPSLCRCGRVGAPCRHRGQCGGPADQTPSRADFRAFAGQDLARAPERNSGSGGAVAGRRPRGRRARPRRAAAAGAAGACRRDRVPFDRSDRQLAARRRASGRRASRPRRADCARQTWLPGQSGRKRRRSDPSGAARFRACASDCPPRPRSPHGW